MYSAIYQAFSRAEHDRGDIADLVAAVQAADPYTAFHHEGDNPFWLRLLAARYWLRKEMTIQFQWTLRARYRRGNHLSRIALRVLIERYAFTNRAGERVIAVEESGRDCDGVAYGRGWEMEANWFAFCKYEQGMYENADGPCSLKIMTERDLKNYEPYTIDTYAEAAGY